MARTGPKRRVQDDFWRGRLDNARGFHRAARDLLDLAEADRQANPVVSHIVTAGIGYADALTARFGGTVNQSDHQAVARAVRAVLGARASDAALRKLARILSEKDPAQYGARAGRLDHARALLGELDAFAVWVEQEIART